MIARAFDQEMLDGRVARLQREDERMRAISVTVSDEERADRLATVSEELVADMPRQAFLIPRGS